ncbi:MAG: fatty acid desaturase [Azospirillaceae bacterium]|nr:fatty acid desaturase [Azospirillaceae bacterium]
MTSAEISAENADPVPVAGPFPSRADLQPYLAPILTTSLWQIVNSFGPLIALWALMVISLKLSYALTLLLALPAAGFVVRIFIIQHDCGHGAFFRARWANDALGTICGLLTLTPYAHWRRQHAGHHANWNNLDRRHSGADIYSTCLTTTEYQALSPSRKALYRLIRHPAVALVALPPLVFMVLYRLPFDTPAAWRRERLAVHSTNLMIAIAVVALGLTIGFRTFLLVQVPITVIAAIIGVWLFSIQHRFEHTLWTRQAQWNPTDAALSGSSYLRLPRLLQWFTGNIGFHHIHHLNARIPNYRLEECHTSLAAFHEVQVLTLKTGLQSAGFWLWDEQQARMVRFP